MRYPPHGVTSFGDRDGKVFTPQRPAGGQAEEPTPGAATPLFMTPTAEVYSDMPDGASADADANVPMQ